MTEESSSSGYVRMWTQYPVDEFDVSPHVRGDLVITRAGTRVTASTADTVRKVAEQADVRIGEEKA